MLEGQRIPRFCADHKAEGMVCSTASSPQHLCGLEGCKYQASFNFEGEQELVFCGLHKLKGMVNLKTLRKKLKKA